MGLDILTPVQSLPTHGARAACTFSLDGELYLGVPQLAIDIAGESPYMNGGDSDIDAPIFRWDGSAFQLHEQLPLPGGEDMEPFAIDGRQFLATAGVRTGHGPYDSDCEAVIYERKAGSWTAFQRLPVFAAKQWRAFTIGSRHFLALAQGVDLPGLVPKHPRTSCLYEWDGERFALFQTTEGLWGYDWIATTFAGQHLLAYADHLGGATVYRWDGERFAPLQVIEGQGARTFRFFEEGGVLWMVCANLLRDATLYRFDAGRFVAVQTFSGAGVREFCLVEAHAGRYLVCVRFITGTPKAPVVAQASQVFAWRGNAFELLGSFETSGATSASSFVADGVRYLVVSNGLSEGVRFRIDSTVYRFDV